MLWFTSNLHLGHTNAIEFKRRPFADIEEMNRVLIENINAVVKRDDELWILGDFSYRINKEQVRELRSMINCRHVHLVKGNHDKDYSADNIFQSVQDYKELKTEYGKLILFHYPIMEWNAAHYGTIHLHGHIHSAPDGYNQANRDSLLKDRFCYGHTPKHDDMRLRIYDVGVDANDYRPVSLDQIAAYMDIHPIKDNPIG